MTQLRSEFSTSSASAPTQVVSAVQAAATPNATAAPAPEHARRPNVDAVAREPEIFAALIAGCTPVQVVIELGVSSADVARASRVEQLIL